MFGMLGERCEFSLAMLELTVAVLVVLCPLVVILPLVIQVLIVIVKEEHPYNCKCRSPALNLTKTLENPELKTI